MGQRRIAQDVRRRAERRRYLSQLPIGSVETRECLPKEVGNVVFVLLRVEIESFDQFQVIIASFAREDEANHGQQLLVSKHVDDGRPEGFVLVFERKAISSSETEEKQGERVRTWLVFRLSYRVFEPKF